jgi:flagellar basal body rod protein FlgB
MKPTLVITTVLMLLFGSGVCFSQSSSNQSLELMFYNSRYIVLHEGIREASKKQAIYAYNIANLSTPGFKPILPPEDQALLNELTAAKGNSQEVMLDFLMARMTENSKRYNAYVTIWKAKLDGVRRIITLGK